MDAAERVSPLQGSLSFPRLLTTSWWDSLRSVMAQAMTYHSPPRHSTPARAARAGDPASGAWEHLRSVHLRALEFHIRFVKDQPGIGLSPCIFEVKSDKARPHLDAVSSHLINKSRAKPPLPQGLKAGAILLRFSARLKQIAEKRLFCALRACLRQSGVVHFQQLFGTSSCP